MMVSPKPTPVSWNVLQSRLGSSWSVTIDALGRGGGGGGVLEVDPVGQDAVRGDEALRAVAGGADHGVGVVGGGGDGARSKAVSDGESEGSGGAAR